MSGFAGLGYLILIVAAFAYIPYLGGVLMPSGRWLKVYSLVGGSILLLFWISLAARADDDVNPLVQTSAILFVVCVSVGVVSGTLTRVATLRLEAAMFSRAPTLIASVVGVAIFVGLSLLFHMSLVKA